jgi:hypothetical protein
VRTTFYHNKDEGLSRAIDEREYRNILKMINLLVQMPAE